MSITNKNAPAATEAAIHTSNHSQIISASAVPLNVNAIDAPYERELADIKDPQSFALQRFSLNGQSAEMRKQMLEDKYILKGLAIYGQYTVFYASPNTGKTLLVLWMLTKAIKAGEIEGRDVYYINADDNHKGLTEKVQVAEKYGFQMLSPSYNGFESDRFFECIQSIIDDDTAKGKIVILDTLKKFTNVMQKDAASEFGKIMRAFVQHGGSIICLGHTNKHKDPNGKSVYGGTSDIADDADCYYMLEEISVTEKTKTVRFENRKSRGDVDKTATFTYTNQRVTSYQGLMDSVETLSESEARAQAEIHEANSLLVSNKEIIDTITIEIQNGNTLKTDLILAAAKSACVSKSKVKKVLEKHTGENFSKGHRWKFSVGDKNAQSYSLISQRPDTRYADLM